MASVTRWTAAFALLVAVLAASGAAPALAEFKSGPWTGNAYAQKDGKFERCVITSEHPDGMRLGFGKSLEGTFEIWLMNKGWSLEAGQPQPVTLWVDDLRRRTGNFQSVSKGAMAAQFVGDTDLVASLKKGNVLHVESAFGSMTFKLTGTFKAIGELEQCWSQSTRAAAAAQAPRAQAPSSGPAKRAKGMDLLALPPRDFAGQVVTSEKSPYFTVPQQVPESMRKWNAALIWNINNGDGVGLSTGVGSNPDIETLRTDLVRQKQPRCKGDMASSSDVRTLPATAIQVKRVEIRCSDIGDGKGVTEVFSFYPHLSGQLLVISHISNDRDVAIEADIEFARRVTAILGAK
ncbi:hypothetical protein GCM10017083_41790 [Thalassobaculum fulvum]|uniref:Uncharacterized protein n=1 Tax=Thalassobaculum fulvum TaxID=1633335 RepID=A0A918XWD0_9PROT|nr:hypothetical protein [Thalassobaculum fulvum]GHD58595.1 hypothetical protein GCM10017083_41790 [Thalassobaculum fulvum]